MVSRRLSVAVTLLVAACASEPSPPSASSATAEPAAAQPPGSTKRHPTEVMDGLDARKPVPLVPAMALHQKENMRDHLAAVQEITAALGKDDLAGAAKAARRLGSSEPMARMCSHMGKGAPGFMEQALAFHAAADRIEEAARAGDRSRVIVELGATLEHCTSCHAVWRQQIVDDATWDALSVE